MKKIRKILVLFKNILPIIALILIWTIFSRYSNPLFLPKPSMVINDFQTLWENGMLWSGITKSFWRITIATLLACGISIPLGLLMFAFKWIDDIISPITNIFRYFPGNAFYPLLILWLGIDDTMKIVFLFLVTFVYFLPTITMCIKDVDKRLIETGYTMGMNKFQVIIYIVLPYSAPSICQSILMMYGMGWTYIPIAEMVNAVGGLGYLINIGSARGRTDIVFMAIIAIMIISWVIDNIGNLMIKYLFNWKFRIQSDD